MPGNFTPPLSPSLESRGGGKEGGEVRILFLGDIVGKPGRRAIIKILPQLKQEFQPDVVMANVENLAHGKGITSSTLKEIITAGIEIGTGGNHTFSKPEANELLAAEPNILVRPANLPAGTPGQGAKMFTVSQKKVFVINLLGQHGMKEGGVDSPFVIMKNLLDRGLPEADAIVLDMHAEATSEKVAMGWYLDGKVSAVLGTHTHVPTADARILPHGTAYITDVGMVGLRDSSLGVDKDLALQRFLTEQKVPHEIPESGIVAVNAVLVDISDQRATSIKKIYKEIEV